jgi:hypothetical protein
VVLEPYTSLAQRHILKRAERGGGREGREREEERDGVRESV